MKTPILSPALLTVLLVLSFDRYSAMCQRGELIFISPTLSRGTNFGGGRVSLAMLELLKLSWPGNVFSVAISLSKGLADGVVPATASRLETALHNCIGYSATLKGSSAARILQLIADRKPECVWLDSSLLGRLARLIRRRFPTVQIFVFFHNIEFDMQKMRVRQESAFYAIACASDWFNERLTVSYADTCVMLTSSDSKRAGFLYGREADSILPVSLPDTAPDGLISCSDGMTPKNPYLLFVGAVFGPNIEAAHFIANELAPLLPRHMHAVIVGRGFNSYADSLSRNNVTVLGTVDNLASLYAGASFVIAPVFSGGGMKVKIAEALMHGKRVLSSSFAAIGYEKGVSSGSVVICDTPRDYVKICLDLPSSSLSTARDDYKTYYSLDANSAVMRDMLKSSRKCASTDVFRQA